MVLVLVLVLALVVVVVLVKRWMNIMVDLAWNVSVVSCIKYQRSFDGSYKMTSTETKIKTTIRTKTKSRQG